MDEKLIEDIKRQYKDIMVCEHYVVVAEDGEHTWTYPYVNVAMKARRIRNGRCYKVSGRNGETGCEVTRMYGFGEER